MTKRDTAVIRSSNAERSCLKRRHCNPNSAPSWPRAVLSRGRHGSHKPRMASITSPMPSAPPCGYRQVR
eukprot:3782644-Pyramimonas_sp.AAC.1